MTPNDIINEVRRLERDSGLLRTPDSYVAETLLLFVNHTIKQTATLRPDLFTNLGEVDTIPGSAVQKMPEDSIRLIEVFYIKGGGSVNEVSHSMMERSNRGWASEEPGMPINYMRHPRNPNRFFLYPPPEADVTLVVDYAQSPPDYGLNDEIQLIPSAYFTALVHGTITAVASINDQMYNPERVALFRNLYEQALGVSAQSAMTLDEEPEMQTSLRRGNRRSRRERSEQ